MKYITIITIQRRRRKMEQITYTLGYKSNHNKS